LNGCLPNEAGKERKKNGVVQDKGNDCSLNDKPGDPFEEKKKVRIGQHQSKDSLSEEAEEKEKSVTEGRTGETENQSASEEGQWRDFSEESRPAVGVKEREASDERYQQILSGAKIAMSFSSDENCDDTSASAKKPRKVCIHTRYPYYYAIGEGGVAKCLGSGNRNAEVMVSGFSH